MTTSNQIKSPSDPKRSETPTVCLMHDKMLQSEPIRFFQKHNIERNDQLTLTQFERLMLDLYPDEAGDSFYDDEHNAFRQQIRDAFLSITESDTSTFISYKDNAFNLVDALSKVGVFPSRAVDFLRLFIVAFKDQEYEHKTVQRRDSESSANASNVRQVFDEIKQRYLKYRESDSPKRMQFFQAVINDLISCVERNNIIDTVENHEQMQQQCKAIKSRWTELQRKITRLEHENKLQQDYSEDANISLKVKEERYKELKKNYDLLRSQLSETNAALNDDSQRWQHVQPKYEKLTLEHKQLKEKFEKIQEAFSSAQQENSRLSETDAALNDVQPKYEKLALEHKRLKEKFEKTQEALSFAQQKNSWLSEHNNSLKRQHELAERRWQRKEMDLLPQLNEAKMPYPDTQQRAQSYGFDEDIQADSDESQSAVIFERTDIQTLAATFHNFRVLSVPFVLNPSTPTTTKHSYTTI